MTQLDKQARSYASQIIFNGWSYRQSSEKKSENIRDIIVESSDGSKKIPEVPKILRKFYSMNEPKVLAFIRGEWFAAEPTNFNDPFDTIHDLISFKNLSQEELKHLIRTFFKNRIWPKEFAREMCETLKNNRLKFESDIWKWHSNEWRAQHGLVCLNGPYLNDDGENEDLMWAHYTNHDGFCAHYEIAAFPSTISNPIPMNYIDKYQLICPKNVQQIMTAFYVTALIKKKVWSYENEFRILCTPQQDIYFNSDSNDIAPPNPQSRLIKLPNNCVTKIILGCKFFNGLQTKKIDGTFEIDWNQVGGPLKKMLIDFAFKQSIPLELLDATRNPQFVSDIIQFDQSELQKSVYRYSLKAQEQI
jgi:hypothetical protein